jgi:hypothetical protein
VQNKFGNNMNKFNGQRFQKRVGPPKAPVDPSKYYCETCKTSCVTQQAYQDHINGKSHKRKVDGSNMPLAKNKSSYRCDVCNVTCTGLFVAFEKVFKRLI